MGTKFAVVLALITAPRVRATSTDQFQTHPSWLANGEAAEEDPQASVAALGEIGHRSRRRVSRGVKPNASHPQFAQRLAAFTLVRGGPSESAYDMFVSSRQCLREAMSSVVQYDDVAFHEGNVPSHMQSALHEKLCAA